MNRKYLFYFLAFASSITYAIVVLMDTFVVIMLQNYDIFETSLAFFFVGSLTAPLIMIVSSIRFRGRMIGEYIDPLFKGIKIPSRRELYFILLGSLGNALASAIYFYMLRIYKDPSAMLTFTSLVSIYLIFADVFIEREWPTLVEVQGIMLISSGAILVSFTLSNVDLFGLFLVFVPMNLMFVIQNIGLKKLEEAGLYGERMDGINVRFWLIIFTAAFIYLLMIPMFGIDKAVGSIYASIEGFLPIFVDMTLTFIAYVFYVRALAHGKMSEVNALYSTNVLFAFLMQVIVAQIVPGIFIVELTFFSLILKLMGMVFVVIGVAALALTEVVAYVFIKVHPGTKDMLNRLIKIRGVETVSATAGTYDFILRIRIRSLGHAYHLITKELDKIPGISEYLWMTTLKEWERYG